jgi:excisionase family DNA binding protein
MSNEVENKYWTYKQVSVYAGISVSTIYSLVSRNQIPYTKPVGNRLVRFNIDEIKKWMKKGTARKSKRSVR